MQGPVFIEREYMILEKELKFCRKVECIILERDLKFRRKRMKNGIVLLVIFATIISIYVCIKLSTIIEIDSYDIVNSIFFLFLPLLFIYFITKELNFIVDLRKVKIQNDCIYIGKNKILIDDIENIDIIAIFQEVKCVRKFLDKHGEWHVKTSEGLKKIDYFMDKPPVANLSGDINIKYKGKQYKVYGIKSILEVAKMICMYTNIQRNKISVYYRILGDCEKEYRFFGSNYRSNKYIFINEDNNS